MTDDAAGAEGARADDADGPAGTPDAEGARHEAAGDGARPDGGGGGAPDGGARPGAAGDGAGEDPAEELRGRLYTELDLLAFALEMEAAERLDAGDGEAAERLQDRRLGVRLAQRRVSGVSSAEVDDRLRRWRDVYRRRLEETRSGELTEEPFRLARGREEGR